MVIDETVVQVLTRADDTHKFVEELIWEAQIEKRKKGVSSGVTLTQLFTVREALEMMKIDYVQLLKDRDLAVKYAKGKEKEADGLCLHN